MGISKASLLSLAAAGIVLAGCQSSRLGNLDNVSPPPPPAPVNAVPAGTVQKGNLDSPTQFPNAPSTDMSAQSGTQVASLPPASAPDLTPGAVAGVWNASLGGQSCKIATPPDQIWPGLSRRPAALPR